MVCGLQESTVCKDMISALLSTVLYRPVSMLRNKRPLKDGKIAIVKTTWYVVAPKCDLRIASECSSRDCKKDGREFENTIEIAACFRLKIQLVKL